MRVILSRVVLLALSILPYSLQAQNVAVPPMALARLSAGIQLDGIPDDAAWRLVDPLPLTALYPRFDSPLTERTEIRVAYDATHFYAAVRAFDSAPHRILANTLYRDRWNGDDEFAVILDTFNDRENAVMFLVTPAGVRVDNLITNNAEPGRGPPVNQDWNVPWEARAQMSDSGWTAEFRVPWTSIRYAPRGRETRMRLKAFRYLPRKGENQMFPPTRPSDGPAPHFQPSLGREVVLLDLPTPRPVFITPYALARNANGAGERAEAMGLDIKFAPVSSVTVDATLNTDFAQVEADDEQINLTRFSLFFPEKRPFFQERSGTFGLSTGGSSTVFYSRRIGLASDGRPLPMRAGVRMTGTVGRIEVGALAAQTAAETAGTPDEYFGVIRARRPLTRSAVIGGMLTQRGRGDGALQSLAFDATMRAGRFGRLSMAIAHSLDSASRMPSAGNGRAFVQLQRSTAGGLSYSAEYRGSGASYSPALGFVQTSGFHEGVGSIAYGWRPGPGSPLREHTLTFSASGRHRTTDHRPDDISGSVHWGFNTPGNLYGGIRVGGTHDAVPHAFPLTGQINVAQGHYTTAFVRAAGGTPFDRRLRALLTVESGGLFGGRRATATLEPTWSQSRHLEVGAVLSATRLDFPGVHPSIERLARSRVRVAVTSQLFVEALLQTNSLRDATTSNLRLRYNPAEGHDLWVAFDQQNEGGGADRRAVIVKYSRMFTFDAGGR